MKKMPVKGSVKTRELKEKRDRNKGPLVQKLVTIPRRVIPDLPLFYQALCEVLIKDGLVQLVPDDTAPDRRESYEGNK